MTEAVIGAEIDVAFKFEGGSDEERDVREDEAEEGGLREEAGKGCLIGVFYDFILYMKYLLTLNSKRNYF